MRLLRLTFGILITTLPGFCQSNAESIRVGQKQLEVRRITLSKGETSEEHTHRGMVLVLTTAPKYFEEGSEHSGSLVLREDPVRVRPTSLKHRYAAIVDMEVIEIELDLPSEDFVRRATGGQLMVGGISVQKVSGSTVKDSCFEVSSEKGRERSRLLCTNSGEILKAGPR